MIDQQKISIEWINKVSKENRNVDKILVEKAIRALLLLEGLVKQELPFVFKGGTALMLHLNTTKRLSIDIDIILPPSFDNLREKLDKIVQEQGFVRLELNERNTQTKIKKEHYKFFYHAFSQSAKEDYVLLDVLFEEVAYSNIVQIPITSTFTPLKDEPLSVKVPCLEDLLGDKLTAFAPNTTGIPYFKGHDSKSMEIIKQLYDIGNIIDLVADMSIITATFYHFAKTELTYRDKNDLNEVDVLNDIFQTALCIVSRGNDGYGNFDELQKGIRSIGSFIFSESYHLEKAINSASKAAYLSVLVKYNSQLLEKFDVSISMQDWSIVAKPKLNKLKKSAPEAFFYWYKTYKIIENQSI
jgi:predicted nucleotidyltransferase component of viral defense system